MTSEPTTEAGRALLHAPLTERYTTPLKERILAIEAEARADAEHSCANHDESLDQAYRKGYGDALAAEQQRVARLREALAEQGHSPQDYAICSVCKALADTAADVDAAPETGWATVTRADLEEPDHG